MWDKGIEFDEEGYEVTNSDDVEEECDHLKWAKGELEFLNDGDEMNGWMYNHLIHMVEEFDKEGHSGFSASYAANILDKLFKWKPIRPLTGEDSEWEEVGENEYQNKRCYNVFKKNGKAYDINGKVFVDKDGCSYTSRDSRVFIEFPYTPKTEYVYDQES